MPDSAPELLQNADPSRRSRLALLAAASLVALLLAEGVLRVYFPEVGKLRQLVASTDDDRGFAPKPGLSIPFDGVFSPLSRTIVWQTNAQGLRADRDIGPPTERFRIATFGDSETFGWSVALEDTFQRRMEGIDPRVEVLNFGVPGYNVTNIRDHLERAVPRFRPDLVVYLVNKNDFNAPVEFTALSYSHVLLHVRFLWHFSVGKPLRRLKRDSLARREVFGREVDRMTRFLEERDTPLVLGFLKWKNRKAVWEHLPRPLPAEARPSVGAPPGSKEIESGNGKRRFVRELVDVKAIVRGEPKEDGHFAGSAHRKLADFWCRQVSRERDGACIPPGWARDGAEPGGAAPTVTARR
jgi:hypothetical protein